MEREIEISVRITKRIEEDWTRDQKILILAATDSKEIARSPGDPLRRNTSLSLVIHWHRLSQTIIEASKAGTDEHVNRIINATNNFDGITEGTVVVDFSKGNVSKVTVSKVEFNG